MPRKGNRKVKPICINPMEVFLVCDCGLKIKMRSAYEFNIRLKECNCGKKTRLIME